VEKVSLLKEHFDEALTVSDLDLATAEAQLERKNERQRGPYVVVATSGTTGEPAIVPFSRRDWQEGLAHLMRSADLALAGRNLGNPNLFRLLAARPRVAGVGTLNPIHVSTQLSASFRTGLVPSLVLSAGTPLSRQQEALARFQPTVLGGYPSTLGPLAAATARGDLPISPRLVFTGGETVTPALRQRVRGAWRTEIFDSFGLSETLIIGGECREHGGMHVYEDAAVLEVVDEAGRPVPVGEQGAGIFVTSLLNRTLPIIRYVVSDRVTLTDEVSVNATLEGIYKVTVLAAPDEDRALVTDTSNNTNVSDLALDVNSALEDAGLAQLMQASADGSRLVLTAEVSVIGKPQFEFKDNEGDRDTIERTTGSWLDDGFRPGRLGWGRRRRLAIALTASS
jgi:acyl-CoA synthetase (AMP-forming)/AMP-acid ligase II